MGVKMDRYEMIETDVSGMMIYPCIVANLGDARPIVASVRELHVDAAREMVRMANAGFKMLRAE